MIGWVVLILIILLAVFVLKTNHLKHRASVIIMVLLILFLAITISIVYDKYELNLNSTQGVFNSIKIYFGWLANGFHNLKTITGNAIRLDWTSANKTFFDKKAVESVKK